VKTDVCTITTTLVATDTKVAITIHNDQADECYRNSLRDI